MKYRILISIVLLALLLCGCTNFPEHKSQYISGVVQTLSGRPVPHAGVGLYKQRGWTYMIAPDITRVGVTQTDKNGRFTVESELPIPAHRYRIRVSGRTFERKVTEYRIEVYGGSRIFRNISNTSENVLVVPDDFKPDGIDGLL